MNLNDHLGIEAGSCEVILDSAKQNAVNQCDKVHTDQSENKEGK